MENQPLLDVSEAIELPASTVVEQTPSHGLIPAAVADTEAVDASAVSDLSALPVGEPKAACMDVLLRHLSHVTSKDIFPHGTLPPDFCVQLQLVEFAAQQGKLLQQMHDRVEQLHICLNDQFGLQFGKLQGELREQVSTSVREALVMVSATEPARESQQQIEDKPAAMLSATAETACQLGLLRNELRSDVSCSVHAAVEAALAKENFVKVPPGMAPANCDAPRAIFGPDAVDGQNLTKPLEDQDQDLTKRLEDHDDRLSQQMLQLLDVVNKVDAKLQASTMLESKTEKKDAGFPKDVDLAECHQEKKVDDSGHHPSIPSDEKHLARKPSHPTSRLLDSILVNAAHTEESAPLKENADSALNKESSVEVHDAAHDARCFESESMPRASISSSQEDPLSPKSSAAIDEHSGHKRAARFSFVSTNIGALHDLKTKESIQRVMESKMGHEADKSWWLHRIVSSPPFDALCTAVILVNAATIGITTQMNMSWVLNHVGEGEPPPDHNIVLMDRVFIFWYLCELLLKVAVFRVDFFFEENWKWNVFDLGLVVFGIYDFLSEFIDLTGGLSITWLRMLRLLKTMKMLRVVRVMRFFKTLRTMLSNVIASISTLFWSVLMLTIIMYMFGLVFMQALTGYLTTANKEAVDLAPIQQYWRSIFQSTVTLYFALTGGADWEAVAAPIKDADDIYFGLFMCYIAFAGFAVLNVVTGMVVDNAMKEAAKDEREVSQELKDLPEVVRFRDQLTVVAQQKAPGLQGFVSDNQFMELLKTESGASFMKHLELDLLQCATIFNIVDIEKVHKVDPEELINGCLHGRNQTDIELANLVLECKKTMHQQEIFMEYMQARMDELLDAISMKDSSVPSIVSLVALWKSQLR